MHIDHPHAQLGSGLDSHGGGVGDVVEFQIEEQLEALGLQRLDHLRAAAGEQLLADLYPAQRRIELVGQRQGGVTAGEVEGDDDGSLAGRHGTALGLGQKRRAL